MLHVNLPSLPETILETLKCYTCVLTVYSLLDTKIRGLVYKISFRWVLSFPLLR